MEGEEVEPNPITMRGATIKIPGRQTEYSWNEVGVACSETE
jgi:hypothetical protein